MNRSVAFKQKVWFQIEKQVDKRVLTQAQSRVLSQVDDKPRNHVALGLFFRGLNRARQVERQAMEDNDERRAE